MKTLTGAVVVGVAVLIAGGVYVLLRDPSGRSASAVEPLSCADIVEEIAIDAGRRFDGALAPVLFDAARHPEHLQFETAIRRGAAEGVDFAGHYAVASWGCGTECQRHAVVDSITGRIVAFGLTSQIGVAHRASSTLLTTNPLEHLEMPLSPELSQRYGDMERSYYNMRNGKLSLICTEAVTAGLP